MARSPLQPLRGTRDFHPEALRTRSWLFAHFREVSRRFGFEEVDAPILESEELFTRKAGEEILDQLYHFELHGRRMALRGEMTPSVARLAIARAGALRLPLRWFMIGQNWRYERMTRGRRREHYQWNVELIGEPGVSAEAELIAAVFTLLDRLGLEPADVRMRVNSRALLEELLQQGVLRARPEVFAPLCVVVDKLDKIGSEAVVEQLCDPAGLVATSRGEAEEVVELLSVDSLEEMKERGRPDSAALADLDRLFELLAAYGISERVAFDASVVRGLAYYTGVVFEAYDAERKLRALCGGGRYDRLFETLGGPSLPAAGFGFGDETILELLGEKDRKPQLARGLQDVVFPLSEGERPVAIAVATALRAEGRSVELVLGGGRPKRVLADAARVGVERVILIGPEEIGRGVMRVRDLSAHKDTELPLPALPRQ
ncbi:MAG: histidine--tRNA ligase [Myxococcota bacterium]